MNEYDKIVRDYEKERLEDQKKEDRRERITKMILITTIVLIAVVITIPIVEYLAFTYPYRVSTGSYFELAWQSSTLAEKHEYMVLYIEALEKQDLTHGQSVIIFPTPRTEMSYNYDIIKKFEERMEKGLEMNINSDEYQWLMRQIENDEIDFVDTDVFYEGMIVRNGWIWIKLVLTGILVILAIIFFSWWVKRVI